MTLTQYIIAWTVYLLSAIGCLAVWWRITHTLSQHRAIGSWLRLWATVAVLTPGLTSPDMPWLSPALFATLYQGLTLGPQAMVGNGMIILAALFVTSIIKLLFFRSVVKKNRKGKEGTKRTTKRRRIPNQRIEPKAH